MFGPPQPPSTRMWWSSIKTCIMEIKQLIASVTVTNKWTVLMTNSHCVDLGFGRRDGKRVMGRESIPNARITHINHWIGQYYPYSNTSTSWRLVVEQRQCLQVVTVTGTRQQMPIQCTKYLYDVINTCTRWQIPVWRDKYLCEVTNSSMRK